MKKSAFILFALALLLCLCPAFASSNEDESARPVDNNPPKVTGISLPASTNCIGSPCAGAGRWGSMHLPAILNDTIPRGGIEMEPSSV